MLFLGYCLTSLVSIFLVGIFRKFAPVHTHTWAFGVCVLTKLLEGVIGFYLLSQAVTFFVIDLHDVLMSDWLKYLLGTIFTAIWVYHVVLYRGREEGLLELDGTNHIKYRYDYYYVRLMMSVVILQTYGSLLYVFYLSFYPTALKSYACVWYARLVFF